MFSQAPVILFTISLMAARSLLILVAYLVTAHLCYLAVSTHPTGMLSCYRPQRSWDKVIFSEACVNNSVHRGGMRGCSWGVCMVAPGGAQWVGGGRQGGQGACMVALGGVCGCSWGGVHGSSRGACMVALGGGVCMVAARGHAWEMMRYGDTINEWVVRILLECILVYKLFLKSNVINGKTYRYLGFWAITYFY